MKRRVTVPPALATKILFANRRRCCICREPRRPVHIHHIDGNPSNNKWDNLAVLCLEEHSDVTGSQGLGRNYTSGEVYLYKQGWEAQCRQWHKDSTQLDETEENDQEEDEETVEPIKSFTKRINLNSDQHYIQEFPLDEADKITFSISSDEPIDFMIMTKRQYNRWAQDEDGTLYLEECDITSFDHAFQVPRAGTWVLLFSNESSDEATIDFDIATWPPTE